jgi:hypothetical protein
MSDSGKECIVFRAHRHLHALIFIGLCGGLASPALIGSASINHHLRQSRTPVRIDFTTQVRPILSEKCLTCHGLDEKKRQAGVRLDLRSSAVGKNIFGHRAIVPGNPNLSQLFVRVTSKTASRMPPPGAGKALSLDEISVLRRWILEGASYQEHWAFQRPVLPRIPAEAVQNPRSKIQNPTWCLNPIDNFILERLTREGLAPNAAADRNTLIRRVSLDLTGLPPSPTEVDAFVNDRSPDAYEKVVDRLLASPHFGEKWARMWLDLARYADSAGYGSDPLRPNIWPYRDWVVEAFNRNMPYDQFIKEQLAGDLVLEEMRKRGNAEMPNSIGGDISSFPHFPISDTSRNVMVATAFHRNTMTNTEGGTDREEFRTAAVKDRAIVTAQVFMGLTLGCAQCHSHKFDPITNKEFYRFMAFFNQTEDNDQPDERPTMPLPTDEQTKKIASLKAEIAALEAKADLTLKPDIDKKKKELDSVKPVALPIMREVPADKRRDTHVLILSNFLQKGEKVSEGVPAAFNPLPTGAPKNRLGVAEWLVSKDNPLTARVAVNRFWSQIFGRGIVETEEDFGHQGTLPTHPELLDWLAMRFRDGSNGVMEYGSDGQSGSPSLHRSNSPVRPWDIKSVIRLIVTSATYRQSSRVSSLHLAIDPRNHVLARYPRRRLDAETVRDQALAISGLLSHKIGGPSVYPPQPPGMWQAAFNGERTWATSTGEDRYRRGLYTFWRRTVPYPSMATFDAPSREICCIRRMPTNTPLQALVTMNDPVYLELAQALGRRIVREGGLGVDERVRYALKLATARTPTDSQVQVITGLYNAELARYRKQPDAAKKLATDPLGPLPAGMDLTEQAAWTVIANVLLNLDGVLTNG